MKLGAVILAAGSGTRMGGVAKALLRVGDRTFLQAIAATAREVGLADAVVVVGEPFADAVAAHARELGLRVVVNPDPARGMASSIARGFAAIADADVDAAWLWPVDHPHVRAATLRQLATALRGHAVARPLHDGHGGHPPLIARAAFAALAASEHAPGGAREVLRGLDVVEISANDQGVVRDIDTLPPVTVELPP